MTHKMRAVHSARGTVRDFPPSEYGAIDIVACFLNIHGAVCDKLFLAENGLT